MKVKYTWKSEHIYINEIIRINYKCNWKCKFCNVYKVNNYWEKDVSYKDVINKILWLIKKYPTKNERKKIILSLSWWEPTLNKHLVNYIKLAKQIWVWTVEIQTNGTILFKKKELILDLIDAWLDEIFLAQHSHLDEINKKLWVYYRIDDFITWVNYIRENKIYKQVNIYLNIVVWKINIVCLEDYIKFLKKSWFLDFIVQTTWIKDNREINLRKISFWLTQPNWYAEVNAKQVLLSFDDKQMDILNNTISYCEKNSLYPDFHFTSPPLCVLNYPDYNLEYSRLKKLADNTKDWSINAWNLDTYKYLWKEKIKFDECKECSYNDYCLGFYKNWIRFFWEEYAKSKIRKHLGKL